MLLSKPAHALKRDVVVLELVSDEKDGLTTVEAKRRWEILGGNELDNGPGVQPLKILFTQSMTQTWLNAPEAADR